MRQGKPSTRFGQRGLHFVCLGTPGTPMVAHLYAPDDTLLATLTERRGRCLDEGYTDFFESARCRPAVYVRELVEILPDGSANVLSTDPDGLSRDYPRWLAFLDQFVSRHEAQRVE